MKSKMYSIKDDNKFLKDQAKGCMRQNNTLRIALQKNYENLERLKAMGPEELRMELLSGNHAKGLVLDPTKINNIGQPKKCQMRAKICKIQYQQSQIQMVKILNSQKLRLRIKSKLDSLTLIEFSL